MMVYNGQPPISRAMNNCSLVIGTTSGPPMSPPKCPLSSNELFELGPNDIALGAAMTCEHYIHACIELELTVRSGALIDGRRAPDRVTFRPQTGSAAREFLLLDVVEELLLALHQEFLDTEILDRVVR
jgi:hypothetical protein